MKKKVIAFFAAVVMIMGFSIATASPASAAPGNRVCNNASSQSNMTYKLDGMNTLFTLHPGQCARGVSIVNAVPYGKYTIWDVSRNVRAWSMSLSSVNMLHNMYVYKH